MKNDPESALEKAVVQRAANKAAANYHSEAFVEAQLATRLIERLDEVPHRADRVLDLGSGPGGLLEALRERHRGAQIALLDASREMLRHTRSLGWLKRRPLRICADLERLPLGADSFDLVVSALALPWADQSLALSEAARVLKPNGLLLFTSYGPDTLLELRQAWSKVDDQPHVHRFLDMHDVGDALLSAGFMDPVMDVERLTVTYSTAAELFRDLRNSGSTNSLLARRRSLTGRRRWQEMVEALEAFRTNGKIQITCEVIFGHAWGPPPGQPQRGPQGEVASVSLEQLRGTLPSQR